MRNKKLINHLKNLKKEKPFTPSNALRVFGMLIRKPLVGPLKFNIDITDKCDMHCVMCRYHSPLLRRDKPGNGNFFIPLERVRSLAKELKTLKTKIVMLCGEGEPLLHPGIEEIVEILKSNSLKAEIITNALYLDKKKIDYFSKAGLKKVIVSLHAPDYETFAKVRPLKAAEDFRSITDNLIYLKYLRSLKKGPEFYIVNVISRLNYEAAEKMAEFAEELRADKILFNPVSSLSDSNFPQDLRLEHSAIQPFISKLQGISRKVSIPNNIRDYITVLSDFSRRKLTRFNRALCHIPFVQSVAKLDGDILGCVYARDYPLGNIYKNSYIDIWFGKEYTKFRKGYFCSGNCLGRAAYPLLI